MLGPRQTTGFCSQALCGVFRPPVAFVGGVPLGAEGATKLSIQKAFRAHDNVGVVITPKAHARTLLSRVQDSKKRIMGLVWVF